MSALHVQKSGNHSEVVGADQNHRGLWRRKWVKSAEIKSSVGTGNEDLHIFQHFKA